MASDLRALLAVVAEFLPVEGVPEMVVYDNLFEQADLGTIDEPLRQILLARRGTIESCDGVITRSLGDSGIIMTPRGRILWYKRNTICRGGDLPAIEGPGTRAWCSFYCGGSSPRNQVYGRKIYAIGDHYRRSLDLPSFVGKGILVWHAQDRVPHTVILPERMGASGDSYVKTPLGAEEMERYRAMYRACLSQETIWVPAQRRSQ